MSDSKFGFVDHVVYINLDHRTDRRAQIIATLAPYFPPEKVTRFRAIKRENGALGCTASHLAVIEMAKAKGWNNVLVLEDDAMWTDTFDESYAVLERLVAMPDRDVIVLTGYNANWYIGSMRLARCTSTTAYLVESHYYDALIENFRESHGWMESGKPHHECALDVHWQTLHAKDTWYIVLPMLMKQRPSFSDILCRYIDYNYNDYSKFGGFVDHVVYINLDHRKDRRLKIEDVLSPYFPPEKVTRFSAIKRENGAWGATESHIAVLEMAKAKGWKNVLILEDDARWTDTFDEGLKTLTRLAQSDYDAIVLGGHNTRWHEDSLRLIRTFGAEATLVHSRYYDTLLRNYTESYTFLQESNQSWVHGVDVYINNLLATDTWFAVVPGLMKQEVGYSDIRKEVVTYTRD